MPRLPKDEKKKQAPSGRSGMGLVTKIKVRKTVVPVGQKAPALKLKRAGKRDKKF